MTTEKAILAGGCFWGMQDLIRKLPGVISTRVGYTGGDVPNATYRNHQGHAEAIDVPQLSCVRLVRAVEQPHAHTLLLCGLDRRYQICVTRNNRRMSDLVLSCQQCKIEPKEQVNSLLLEDRRPWLSLPRYTSRPSRTSNLGKRPRAS